MKKILSLLFSFVVIFGSCSPSTKPSPKAIKGVLDLQDWDFDPSTSSGTQGGDGIIKLDGEWEFYWQEFLSLEDIQKWSIDKIHYINVPSTWNNVVSKSNSSQTSISFLEQGHGYATYRLKIINIKSKNIKIKINTILVAYKLYINNELYIINGFPSKTSESIIPSRNKVIIKPSEGDLDIVLHISNFNFLEGGLWESIEMGTELQIDTITNRAIFSDLFVSGVVFIIGIYHIGLFYQRRVDRFTLWFGLFCFFISLRSISSGEYFIFKIFPALSFNIGAIFEYLPSYFGLAIFNLYINSLFPNERIKSLDLFFIISSIILGFIVILFPSKIYTVTFDIIDSIIFLFIIYTFYINILSIKNKRIGSKTFFVAFIVFSLSIFNDILYDNGIFIFGQVATIGFVLFIFSQAYLISARFSIAYLKSEELAHKLNLLADSLELKVIERTEELNQKKSLAEKALSDLQETQSQLIEAERLASLGQLVGGVAHEINNPIGVIRSNSELIEGNLNSILQNVPSFVESLNSNQKEVFYTMVNQSMQNKEFLSTKEERARKKEIKKELEEILLVNKDNLEYITEQILILKLKSSYKHFINHLGEVKFIEALNVAQIFVKQSHSITNIEIAVEKASRVIFALRSYLNTELFLEPKEVDLVMEIEKALHLYDNYIIGKVKVIKEYSSEIKYNCIVENISQVWKNIIFNAIHAMYLTDKKLEVQIQKVSSLPDSLKIMRTSALVEDWENPSSYYILVTFVDSGHGIPENLQDKIFTPFFTTKALGEGIGLGLYVSKKIIHDHGGRIYFSSKEGRTEFIVVLPIIS